MSTPNQVCPGRKMGQLELSHSRLRSSINKMGNLVDDLLARVRGPQVQPPVNAALPTPSASMVSRAEELVTDSEDCVKRLPAAAQPELKPSGLTRAELSAAAGILHLERDRRTIRRSGGSEVREINADYEMAKPRNISQKCRKITRS